MGSRWNAAGPLEVGIDGYVELFRPVTGEPTGLHLSVQSKAVTQFSGDATTVRFPCRRADIEYWLSTSPPVILVVSNPAAEEAYWLSIKDYFGSDAHKGETTARFDRRTQRLNSSSYDALLSVATPPRHQPVRSPLAAQEMLYSNLVPLERCPSTIYVAVATIKSYGEARSRLAQSPGQYPPPWALREGMVFTFDDPSESLITQVADLGTLEEHSASNWSESAGDDERRLFVELLNSALKDHLGKRGVRYFSDDHIFAFKCAPEGAPRKHRFSNLHHESTITVVSSYETRAKDGRVFPFPAAHGVRRQLSEVGRSVVP